jgi:VanZ family protein
VTAKSVAQSPDLPVAPSDSFSLRSSRRWAVAWGVFLLTLTSWPSPPHVPGLEAIPGFDKLVHFGLYSVEAFLLYRAMAWPGRQDIASFLRALAVVGVMAVWAVADEVHQFWIPDRSMEGADVLADVVGGFAGALAATAVAAQRFSRRGGRGVSGATPR